MKSTHTGGSLGTRLGYGWGTVYVLRAVGWDRAAGINRSIREHIFGYNILHTYTQIYLVLAGRGGVYACLSLAPVHHAAVPQ